MVFLLRTEMEAWIYHQRVGLVQCCPILICVWTYYSVAIYAYHERLVRLPDLENKMYICVTLLFLFFLYVILSVNEMQFFHSTSYFVHSTIILSIRKTSVTWQLFEACPWVNKCRVHTPHNTTCPVLKRIFLLVSSRQLIGHDRNGHVIDNHHVSEYGNFPHNTFVSVCLFYFIFILFY